MSDALPVAQPTVSKHRRHYRMSDRINCWQKSNANGHTSSHVFFLLTSARGPDMNCSQLSCTGTGKPRTHAM